MANRFQVGDDANPSFVRLTDDHLLASYIAKTKETMAWPGLPVKIAQNRVTYNIRDRRPDSNRQGRQHFPGRLVLEIDANSFSR
jgi:hypothetical protein